MITFLRRNPVIAWFIRRKARPSIPLTLALGVGSWIVSAVLMLAAFQRDPASMPLPNQLLLWATFGMTLVSLSVAVSSAVMPTISDVRSGRRQLLQMTNLSDEMLVHSYIFTALYRLRVLLALVVGLSPALMIGWAHRLTVLNIAHLCSLNIRPCNSIPPEIGPVQVGVMLALSAVVTIITVGLNMMSASFGVWMALRWQHIAPAVAFSLAIMGLVLLPLVFVLALLMKGIIEMALRWPDIFTLFLMVLFTTVIGLVTFTIGEYAMRSAQRWVWGDLPAVS